MMPFTPLELLAWLTLAGLAALAIALAIFAVVVGVALWKEHTR